MTFEYCDSQDVSISGIVMASTELGPPPEYLWDDCTLCGKKIGFNGGDTYITTNGVRVGYCNDCYIKYHSTPLIYTTFEQFYPSQINYII